ncbi:unnamed protein product [Rotaria magnacalcarata]|uniref:Uncharacterized protein n=1 Tax=Rotaria magnacalcarata TaxID=392030 RepID=A0A819ECF5_9BILA|nr:unnamed protein product [Rotaria magnacalcarata]
MPNCTQATHPYAPRRYQIFQQDTNNVSNQASVQEIQCDVNELPDMSSGSSGVSSRAKPIISKTVLIVLLVIVCVVAIAAITVPLLLTFLTSAMGQTSEGYF